MPRLARDFTVAGIPSTCAVRSPGNADVMWKAFFNTNTINRICKDHGIRSFEDRLTFGSTLDCHLSGIPVNPPPPPVVKTFGQQSWIWHDAFLESGKTIKQLKKHAVEVAKEIAESQARVKALAKEIAAATKRDTTTSTRDATRALTQGLTRDLLRTRKRDRDAKSEQMSPSEPR